MSCPIKVNSYTITLIVIASQTYSVLIGRPTTIHFVVISYYFIFYVKEFVEVKKFFKSQAQKHLCLLAM